MKKKQEKKQRRADTIMEICRFKKKYGRGKVFGELRNLLQNQIRIYNTFPYYVIHTF